MRIEKLRAAISELERELHDLKTLDHESRRALEEALADIRAALDEKEPSKIARASLSERLKSAVQTFEGSHPALTDIVYRVVDGLAQMGI